MSDLFNLGNLGVDDFDSGGGVGSPENLKTGDLRRKYNFGNRVSELSIPQDPFFRFLSKVGKKPTDDPQFKWTEKRDSWHKRYAYVIGHVANGADSFADSELDQSNAAAAVSGTGQKVKVYMATDFKNKGNIQSIYNNLSTDVEVGATDTRPGFFLPGQLVKIPVKNGATDTGSSGYHILKVETVTDGLTKTSGGGAKECVALEGTIIKFDSSGNELASFYNDTPSAGGGPSATDNDAVRGDRVIHSQLEPIRSYVMGTSHDEGSGYPETWKDQPYSTNYGRTQIWKTSMAMTNTARATVLKYEPTEWARVWKEKLVEHKWDIEQSLLFGVQDDTYYTTQGAIDYVTQFGNSFDLNTATKTADDFLDDMSSYLDPRYNNSGATVFFCNTAVYNWLHKLGGYFKNNLEVSPQFRSDIAMTGKKKVFGVDITTFSTPYGDMNVARNIHLDASNVKMIGINMKYAAYRPLVGNGVNRDTSVYVGVQTLENSGIDRRVDLILTEAGLELSMPECHALWT